MTAHGNAMLSRDPKLGACGRPLKQLGEPAAAMICRWEGCEEAMGDSQEGAVDQVEGRVEWLYPLDFYIHVSGHAYTEIGLGCLWANCHLQESSNSLR